MSPDALERERSSISDASGARLLLDAEGQVVAASESCAVVFERDVDRLCDQTLSDLVEAGFFDGDLRTEFQTVVADLKSDVRVDRSERSATDDNQRTVTEREGDQRTVTEREGDQRTVTGHVRPGGTADRLPYHVTIEPVRDGGELVGTRWSLSPVGTRERYEETLESLHRTTRELMGAESELTVYERIGRAANDIMGFPGTGVRIYDPDREVLRHVAFGNEETVIDSRPPYDVDDSPHGEAFLEGHTVTETIGDDDPYDREVFTHVMYVPIAEYGVLSFGTVGDPFVDTDVRFAEILAENASVAIREVRRREELAAKRQELERYETILEAVPDPVYAMDDDGRITFANDGFVDFFGYDPATDAVELATVTEDAATIVRRIERLQAGTTSEDGEGVEIEGITRDGRRRRLEVSLAPLPASDDASTAGVLRDVTARKRREEVLTVMNRALRHNLRTNAHNIFAYTHAIEDELPPDHAQYADRIADAADWLVKLGETLRTLQRAITDSADEAVEIGRIVDSIADQYRESYPDATVAVDSRTDGQLAGGYALQFALDNLVENAIVHNDRDEPRIVISIAETDRPGWLAVTVADDGPGIPREERAVVLGDAEISQLQHGSGLGLWVTRWIVRAFDGEIDISDRSPRGTEITLRLPWTEPE